MLRVGVIGLGTISRFYAEALPAVAEVELAAACDVDEGRLAPYRGRVHCFSDHRELLAAPGIDAVVVNVPNDLHHAVCRDALLARKHVCVEKPLATTLEHGRELARLSAGTGAALFTAFHRRYNVNITTLREQLHDAPQIVRVEARYLEDIDRHAGADAWYLEPERCGGGCVADNGPNVYDLLRLLLGDVEVERAELVRDARGVDVEARVGLRSQDGVPADVELDWAYDGELKDVSVELADGTTLRADMLAGFPAFKSSLAHEYVGVLGAFAAAAGHGEDGLEALRLVHATYEAANVGAAA